MITERATRTQMRRILLEYVPTEYGIAYAERQQSIYLMDK
jgi:hypothetical protein